VPLAVSPLPVACCLLPGGEALIANLTAFARALRDAGAGPSPAELADAAAALRVIDPTERETVRLALRACLAKDDDRRAAFDRLFDAWFAFPWPAGEAGKPKKQRRNKPAGGGDKPRPGVPGKGEAPHGEGRRPEPEESEQGRGAARSEAQRRRVQAVARARRSMQERRQRQPSRIELRRRPTPAELAGLDREVARLGRLLRTDFSRRWRRARRDRLDLRATVAAASRTGGVPLKLVHRSRRIGRQRVVVLCDVSGSTIRTARFLLALLAELHRSFDRVDPFVFVDRPVSAASLLAGDDLDWRLEHLSGLDLRAYSDFGNTFIRLLTDEAHLLHPRATLLVLGDARCNRFDPQVWALEEIASRVRQVVWLNPERRDRWYTHDSRLRDYEPLLTHLLPAETLAELAAGLRLCR